MVPHFINTNNVFWPSQTTLSHFWPYVDASLRSHKRDGSTLVQHNSKSKRYSYLKHSLEINRNHIFSLRILSPLIRSCYYVRNESSRVYFYTIFVINLFWKQTQKYLSTKNSRQMKTGSQLQSPPPTVHLTMGRSSDAQYRASSSTDALVMLPQPLTSKTVSWQQCCNRLSIAVKITREKCVHISCLTSSEIHDNRILTEIPRN